MTSAPTAATPFASTVRAAEVELTGDPRFGAAAPILGRAEGLYGFGLELAAEALRLEPPLRGLAERTWQTGRFVRDPVVRAELDRCFELLKRGELEPGDELVRVLDDARSIPDVELRGPLAAGATEPLPTATIRDHEVWLWTDAAAAGPFGPRLERAFLDSFGTNPTIRLVSATDETRDDVQAGLDTLCELVPDLAANALAHMHGIAAVEGESVFYSASIRAIPDMVFVRRDVFADSLALAEALLHEATHHKLYDLYATRAVLGSGYDDTTCPQFVAFWNKARDGIDTNVWPIDRVLAAAHVYVHLAVLFGALVESGRAPDAEARLARAVERAGHLTRHLESIGFEGLGPDGAALTTWLARIGGELREAAGVPA